MMTALMAAIISVLFALLLLLVPVETDVKPLFTVMAAAITVGMQTSFLYPQWFESGACELLCFAFSTVATLFVPFGYLFAVSTVKKWVWFGVCSLGKCPLNLFFPDKPFYCKVLCFPWAFWWG
jgi:hypothetical protein